MQDLRCMSYTGKGKETNQILVAGWQDQMFLIDVEKGTIVKQVGFLLLLQYALLSC
jgi:PAB-dependent poly(A)-specific ribonuclease subunit 2